jgi:hypothetical protein
MNDSSKIPQHLLSKEDDPLKGKISPENEIVIDIDKVLELEDDSITDFVLIRQIGLATTRYEYVSKETAHMLGRKIKSMFHHAALYPEVMRSFDIKPDGGRL